MNRKLILVLVIAVALVGTMAFAMHSKKAPATKETAQKFTLEEMPALPHTGEVQKMDLRQALVQKPIPWKTLTPTDPEKYKESMIENAAQVPFDAEVKYISPSGEIPRSALTECLIYVHDYETCCYYYLDWDDELWGWGAIKMATWNDPQADPVRSACGYPIFPFAVKGMEIWINAPTVCTLYCSFDIMDFDWDYNTPYPGDVIYESPVYQFIHPGAFAYLGVSLAESICVYDRYFVSWTFYNTDDYDPEGGGWCLETVWPTQDSCVYDTWCDIPWVPNNDSCVYDVDTVSFDCVEPPNTDEDSCLVSTGPDVWGHFENVVTETTWGQEDTAWGHNPPYSFGLNILWDQGGKGGHTYWSFGYYWTIGVWWDVVTDLPAFGMGWNGAVRIRSWGAVVDQNECPILPDQWWQKEEFYVYDEDAQRVYAYAPCGVPDFDQKAKEVAHTEIDAPWDGPTALANCLWWMVAAEKLDMFWTDIGVADLWMPENPPIVINHLAEFMNFGDCGVGPDEFDAGLDALVEEYVLWVDIKEMHQPTWEFIEYEVRLCEDVILLLGFWYPEIVAGEPPETTWYRIGGHWVTTAGVDHINGKIKISDPDLDWAEVMQWTDFVCSFEHYIAHDHGANPFCHFDAGNVSHDPYAVAPSITPCGVLMLPDYPYAELDLAKYLGHNNNPYCPGEVATELPGAEVPIFVEIEFAKSISPVMPYTSEQIDSWNVAMVKTNHGEEGPGYITWADGGTDQLFEGTVILGTTASNLALSVSQVGTEHRFFPYTGIEIAEHYLWGTGLDPADSMYLDTCYTKFFHNVGLPLDVEMFAIGFDPWGDSPNNIVGKAAEDMILQKFVITNTGDATIDDLEWALFADWDVNLPDPNTSFGGGDSTLNTGWAYDSVEEGMVIYTTLVPSSPGKIAPTWHVGEQNDYFYPFVPGGPYDDLKAVMETPYWVLPQTLPPTFDYGYLMSSENFSLDPGEKALQEYIIWFDSQIPSTDYTHFRHKLYDMLRMAGYYRGDVGDFSTGVGSPGVLDISDIVLMVNFSLKSSGIPPKPFINQGDVDCDGEAGLTDIVFLVNYCLKGSGLAPTDKDRFFPPDYQILFSRPSLFTDPQWRDLGS